MNGAVCKSAEIISGRRADRAGVKSAATEKALTYDEVDGVVPTT